MIRVIIKTVITLPSGEISSTNYQTFDLHNFELEKRLTIKDQYITKTVIGTEIIKEEK